MMTSTRSRTFLVASLAAVATLFAVGSRVAGAASGADLSPQPPTFNAQFETRNPRVCTKVTHVPNVSEATVMAQCAFESTSRTGGSSPGLFLATDISLQLASPKSYNPRMDSALDDIDPSAPVYAVRGSSTSYSCIPSNAINRGRNCGKSFGGEVGHGACWHTQFNEWRCFMTMGGTNQELQVKGPVAY